MLCCTVSCCVVLRRVVMCQVVLYCVATGFGALCLGRVVLHCLGLRGVVLRYVALCSFVLRAGWI